MSPVAAPFWHATGTGYLWSETFSLPCRFRVETQLLRRWSGPVSLSSWCWSTSLVSAPFWHAAGTTSLEGVLSRAVRAAELGDWLFRCACGSPLFTGANGPLMAWTGERDLLIRRSGQIVQTCPGLAACWADIPGPSLRVGSWPWSWQQFWQQSGICGARVIPAFRQLAAVDPLHPLFLMRPGAMTIILALPCCGDLPICSGIAAQKPGPVGSIRDAAGRWRGAGSTAPPAGSREPPPPRPVSAQTAVLHRWEG
jgi:hypothetical protein